MESNQPLNDKSLLVITDLGKKKKKGFYAYIYLSPVYNNKRNLNEINYLFIGMNSMSLLILQKYVIRDEWQH